MLALGHPQGLVCAVTAGLVIGSENEASGPEGAEWITPDLPFRPGYSGGPLETPEAASSALTSNGPNVSMAAPIPIVKAFLRRNLGGARNPHPEPVFREERDAEERGHV